MKKIIPVLLSCCFFCTLLCSCQENSSSDADTQSDNKTTDSSVDSVQSENKTTEDDEGSLSDNSQTASVVTGTADTKISPDRLNDDYASLEKKADELFKKYYDGIKKDDYKTFAKVFPDFYLEALEEEGKDYNQTNEEFIKSINSDNKSKYGDDYYSFAKVTAILQLTDESLNTLKTSIKDTFGKKVKLEDAYSVYITQTTRGSITKDSADMDYIMLIIDGKYYLYDEYFTDMDESK